MHLSASPPSLVSGCLLAWMARVGKSFPIAKHSDLQKLCNSQAIVPAFGTFDTCLNETLSNVVNVIDPYTKTFVGLQDMRFGGELWNQKRSPDSPDFSRFALWTNRISSFAVLRVLHAPRRSLLATPECQRRSKAIWVGDQNRGHPFNSA